MWEWQTSYCKLLHTIVGKKVHKKIGIWANLLCNRFSIWCPKFVNMMDVDVVWKCRLLDQKRSKCLNSFLESIYFSVTFSISCFVKILCSDSGLMNSLDHNIMAPQNFDPKSHIQKRVLKICWPKLISGVLRKIL